MDVYLQASVVIALLLGVGLLFIASTKKRHGQGEHLTERQKTLRRIGACIVIFTTLLIVFGLLSYNADEVHQMGH
ncbi:hypothetical protein BBD42_12790 [Paenibacillus sp. BIHB 4019]|uniref:Uncharacterized protein n=1 Tax=Paenibacillus sp. BIHB 4019 TaxID=1870819 RepID=A0A1B2DHN7_9BACL|nr:hypothetical protein [Paenibacillus sp. BIHB 4019]ANY67247.1 hypothetical protein BBD42_12790 [Paenibacillus sp. BIHB 4019]